jgi:hypothetical protein
MASHGFPERLKDKVDEEIAEEHDRLAKGLAADWPDYKKRCGFVEGLKRARQIIVDLDERESR